MSSLTIQRPDDFHHHLRTGVMFHGVAWSARHFGLILVMPNLPNAILTGKQAKIYKHEIMTEFKCRHISTEPLMTIQITEATTPKMIYQAKECGIIAGKAYPKDVTTNSENGIIHYADLSPVYNAMSDCGMVLCLHGELPDPEIEYPEKEKAFLVVLDYLNRNHPSLRVVLEHITSADAVQKIKELPDNFAATITAHHLWLYRDDVVGSKVRPHNFCLPTAKTRRDREALVEAATSGNPKFFFGSDSAPHLKENKECPEGCAGIFTAPVALPLLAQKFEERGSISKLEDFVSQFGRAFYGLPASDEKITLVKNHWQVPAMVSGIVPFQAGETLEWQVV